MAQTVDGIIKLLLGGTYIPARKLRTAIDRDPLIRQKLALSEEYSDRLNEFAKAANKAIEEDKSRFTFDGNTYGTTSAKKVVGSLRNRGDRANFRQINRTIKKLFPDMMEGKELGHKNISVLRAGMSGLLKIMPAEDPRRGAVRALYATVLEIDSITDPGEASLEAVLSTVEKAAKGGFSVKGKITKDVNTLKGIKQTIELEGEFKELNQLKGRLAARMGSIFKEVIEGETKAFEKLFSDVDITNIKGSPTLQEDIEQDLFEIIDPKKKRTRKKSSRRTSSKKGAAVASLKVKRPKKKKTSPLNLPKEERGVATAPLALIGIMNKELPRVVQKNMVAPRLQYQTGRFASSVRVTEMAMTPQGFPSIGYTYDRNNYETFELGNRQGSPDRDPRALIDTSIREIAARYAIGRFYTRRV